MTSVVASKRPTLGFGSVLFALGAAVAIFVAPRRGLADPSPSDKAAAQALFDEGKKLLKEKNYPEACPKLAESLRIDPALGTKLHLADCYEKNGQTASAWVLFREAAEQAKIAGQAERMKKATERASALELRLCHLRIDVSVEAEVTGVEVKRDGTVLGPPSWGTSVPLDPGEHRIEAEAQGKKPWSAKVVLKDGETAPVIVTIPALEDLPKPPPPPVPEPAPPPPEPPKVEPPPAPLKPKLPVESPSSTPKATPGPVRAAKPPPPPPATSTATKVGYALTTIGGVGTVVGGIFGMLALAKNSDALPNCKHSNACNAEGANDRSAALRFANVSTVTLIAGGGVFVAGVVTLIAARDPDPPEKLVIKLTPLFGPGVGGLLLRGAF